MIDDSIAEEHRRDLQEECRRDSATIRNSKIRTLMFATGISLEGVAVTTNEVPTLLTVDNAASVVGAGITLCMGLLGANKASKHKARLQQLMEDERAFGATQQEMLKAREDGLHNRSYNARLYAGGTATGAIIVISGQIHAALQSTLTRDPSGFFINALQSQPIMSAATGVLVGSVMMAGKSFLNNLRLSRKDKKHAKRVMQHRHNLS